MFVMSEESKKNKPYDRLFRFALSIEQVAEQFMLSNLESKVQDVLDLNTLQEVPSESIHLKLSDSISDVVYQCQYKDTNIPAAKIIILVEHQSTPDRFMPLRVYHYLFGLLLNEVKSRKTDRNAPLPACWAMIFYHGKKKHYPYPLDLASAFDDPKDIMQEFWNNSVQLNNVNDISDEQLLERKLDGILALTLKHSRDKEASDVLHKIINKFAEIDIRDPVELQFANEIVSHIFNQSDIDNRDDLFDTIESLTGPLRGELMTAAERFREEGIVKGIEQNKIETVINCFREGAHVEFIVRITGLTKAEILKIVKEHNISIN